MVLGERKMEQYIAYLNETITALQVEEQDLIRSERKDDANFIRIKINICDICRTIYNVSAKTYSGVALKEEYTRQLTRLPENWKISLDKAKEHGDTKKIVVEETKLEMFAEIKQKFEELGACE